MKNLKKLMALALVVMLGVQSLVGMDAKALAAARARAQSEKLLAQQRDPIGAYLIEINKVIGPYAAFAGMITTLGVFGKSFLGIPTTPAEIGKLVGLGGPKTKIAFLTGLAVAGAVFAGQRYSDYVPNFAAGLQAKFAGFIPGEKKGPENNVGNGAGQQDQGKHQNAVENFDVIINGDRTVFNNYINALTAVDSAKFKGLYEAVKKLNTPQALHRKGIIEGKAKKLNVAL